MFKGKIAEIVKEQANENLNAKVDFGDFNLGLISTFPNFKFSINNVKVEGIGKFNGVELANIKNLTLKVDLMSVISGNEIKIKTILIDNPTINAVVLADSSANWNIAKPSTNTTTTEETSSESSPFKLGLKDFTIKNANITYNDATMNLTTTIKGLNFNLSGDMTADITNLKTHTSIDTLNLIMGHIAYFKNTIINIDATIKADLKNNKYTFINNKFKINSLVLQLDGWLAMFDNKDDIDMDLKFGAKQTEFKNILSLVPAVYMTDFKDVKTKGKLVLNGFAKGTYKENHLPAFGLELKIADAMFKYPSVPKAINNIQVDLQVENSGGSADNTLINLKRFYMEMAGNPIDIKMKVKTPVSDPDIDGAIKVKLDLASIKDIMPNKGDDLNGKITSNITLKGKVSSLENKKYEDFKAKGQFIVLNMNYKSDSLPYDVQLKKMYLNFYPQFVELSSFKANFGKTDIQASGKIENFIAYAFSNDQVLKGKFNLTSNNIDLNEFMTEDSTSTATTDTTSEKPLSVIEVPKNIDFTLNSKLNKVIYDNLIISNLKGELAVKDQKVSMNGVDMNLLGGNMKMDGFYETTNPEKPRFKYNMDIQNFDIETVVKTFNTVEEMVPIAKSTRGRFNTTLKLNGNLDKEMMPDLNTLSGKGNMQTKSVRVIDFKALNVLAKVLKNDKLKTINVDDTKIKYEIKDGRVYLQPFKIKMGNINGALSGSNGFDESIDYKMALKIPSKEIGIGGAINKLNGKASSLGLNLKSAEFVNINVLMTGTVDNPKIKVNLKGAVGSVVNNVKDQLKDKAKEEIDKGKEEAKKKAREEADKLIAEVKTQADKIRAESKTQADKARAEGKKLQESLNKKRGNFFEKKADKVLGQKAVNTANKLANKIEAEGNKKANAIEAKAKQQADAIMAKVENK